MHPIAGGRRKARNAARALAVAAGAAVAVLVQAVGVVRVTLLGEAGGFAGAGREVGAGEEAIAGGVAAPVPGSLGSKGLAACHGRSPSDCRVRAHAESLRRLPVRGGNATCR